MLTTFVVVVIFPMVDGKRPRDKESSALPRGLPWVCREFFRGRYFSVPPSFICFCIWSCHDFDDTCMVVGWHRRVPVSGS